MAGKVLRGGAGNGMRHVERFVNRRGEWGVLTLILVGVAAFSFAAAWSVPPQDQPENAPAPEPATISKQLLAATPAGQPVPYPPQIRVRVGDEPGWESPEFNDADWDVTEALQYPSADTAAGAPPAPIWFRFRVRFAPDVIGVPLVFRANPHQKDVQVFLNGVRVAGPQDLDPSTGVTPRCFVPTTEDTLVALRWAPNPTSISATPYAFSLAVRDYASTLTALDQQRHLEARQSRHRVALISIFMVFFLFNLGLYRCYPLRRENIYYCLTALFCLLALTSLHISELHHYNRVVWRIFYADFFLAFLSLSVISGLGLFQLLFSGRIRRSYPLYVLAGVCAYVGSLWFGNMPVHVFPLLTIPEVAWIVWTRRNRKVLLFSGSALATFVLVNVFVSSVASLYHWDSASGFLRYASWYAFAIFLQVAALAFAREFADAKKRIETLAASLQEQVITKTHELNAAADEILTLQGILPICMYCHKIRDDQQSWQQLERYIQEHSDAMFSHGVCPECLEKYYPDADKG